MSFLVFNPHGCLGWIRTIISCLWCGFAIAWVIVFVLWSKALMAYGKAYREYEQAYGKPHQSPCEANKYNRVMLQFCRRLYLFIGNARHKIAHVPSRRERRG